MALTATDEQGLPFANGSSDSSPDSGSNLEASASDFYSSPDSGSNTDAEPVEAPVSDIVPKPETIEVAPVSDKGEIFEPTEANYEDEDFEEYPEDFPPYSPEGILASDGTEISIEGKREDTRGRLAVIYTAATFVMFLLGFLAAFVDALSQGTSIIDNLVEILPLISGIFLGSLGFVLGYYFRKSENE